MLINVNDQEIKTIFQLENGLNLVETLLFTQ